MSGVCASVALSQRKAVQATEEAVNHKYMYIIMNSQALLKIRFPSLF